MFKEIGNRCFSGCLNLTEIDIPDCVETIDCGAFLECHNLTNVTIPSSVTIIGKKAFFNCTQLRNVYFNGTRQPDIFYENAFYLYWLYCMLQHESSLFYQ